MSGAFLHASHGPAGDLFSIALGHDWKKTRGVLFLDPFGLQCSYQLLQQISATQALDVFFLVSLSGLYRQAAVNEKGIDAGKAAKLTTFLGTDEWRSAIYKRALQDDFFSEPEVTSESPRVSWRPVGLSQTDIAA